MKKIVIIKTGDTLPEVYGEFKDFEHWIMAGLAVEPGRVEVFDAVNSSDLPAPGKICGAVIAGSHAMVTENLGWSVNIESWIPKMIEKHVPLLGICYGHQLIARAMGGAVDYHPEGMELGTVEIMMNGLCSDDPLFMDFPDRITAHVSHSQSVIELPETAALLAFSDFEPHHAFRIGINAWGLQFHPEYDEAIMQAYITQTTLRVKEMADLKTDLLARVQPTPHAAQILARFGDVCGSS